MRNKITITSILMILLTSLLYNPVIGYAAENEEISTTGETSIDVGASNGSSFKVSIPTSNWPYASYKEAYEKYGYIQTSPQYQGDLPADQYIDIQIDKETSYNETTGTKNPVATIANFGANSENAIRTGYDLQGGKSFSKTVYIKAKKLSAGEWKCPIHYTISIKNAPVILSEANIATLFNDKTVTEITIPATFKMNGKTYDVGGLDYAALRGFSNLQTINLEKSNARWYNLNYGWIGSVGKNGDVIVNCNQNNMVLNQVSRSYQFHYKNTGLCYIYNNPFGGELGSNYYTPVTDFDFSKVVYCNSACPVPVEECILGSNLLEYAYGFTNAKKITFPLQETTCEYTKFSGNTEEIYYDDEIVTNECFANMTNLKKVVLGPHVRNIRESAFSGCSGLTEIIIPETVTMISTSAFNGTPFLDALKENTDAVYINGIYICKGNNASTEEVYMSPKDESVIQAESINDETKITFEADRTLSAETVKFSGTFNTVTEIDFSNVRRIEGSLSQNFPNLKKVTFGGSLVAVNSDAVAGMSTVSDIILKEGLTSINQYAFNHCTGYDKTSITIPASVTMIGEPDGNRMTNHVFYDFGKDGVFNEFKVADGSNNFVAVDGILYTKDLKTLVAVPRAKVFANGIMTLPDETENLGELSFSRNTSVKELVLGDNIVIHSSQDELKSSTYIPNNTGNSLSCAVYEFTSIEKYTVKESNPNYVSVNGIIYSKDMKKLIAVPHSYKGNIIVPEGVEEWCENALWLNSDTGHGVNEGITSITIPKTMQKIDKKQLAFIRNLGADKVNVAAGNQSYMMYYNYGAYARGLHSLAKWNDSSTYSLTGGIGYTWISGSDSRIGNSNDFGINRALQTFEFIGLEPGTYTVTWNTDKAILWRGILVKSDGTGDWAKSNSANEINSDYITEKSYTFTVDDTMNVLAVSAGILNEAGNENSNKTSLSDEEKAALVSALTITKAE